MGVERPAELHHAAHRTRARKVGMVRYEEDGNLAPAFVGHQLGMQLRSVEDRHAQLGHDEPREPAGSEDLEGMGPVVGGAHTVATAFEQILEGLSSRAFVVDDQDAGLLASGGWHQTSQAMSSN